MPLDPNLVYVILIIGLWLVVTAAYIPGTGVAEVLAFVGVAVALVALANLPTNWWAVILIVVGVLSFLMMPILNQRFAALSIGGLALQAVGSVFLFNGTGVSLPLIVVMIAVALGYHRFALLRILEFNRSAPAMLDDQPLVGAHGYVQSALDPVGTVYVRGESWTARSEHNLKVGAEIVVVEQSGLTLFVEAVKLKRHPEEA